MGIRGIPDRHNLGFMDEIFTSYSPWLLATCEKNLKFLWLAKTLIQLKYQQDICIVLSSGYSKVPKEGNGRFGLHRGQLLCMLTLEKETSEA